MDTAYKDYESARPRTASRNESVRILLLFVPMFMYNAWCLAKYLAQASSHTARMMLKELLKLFLKFIQDSDQTALSTRLAACVAPAEIKAGSKAADARDI